MERRITRKPRVRGGSQPAHGVLRLVQQGVRATNVEGSVMKVAVTLPSLFRLLDGLLRPAELSDTSEKHGFDARELTSQICGRVLKAKQAKAR